MNNVKDIIISFNETGEVNISLNTNFSDEYIASEKYLIDLAEAFEKARIALSLFKLKG